MGHIDLARTVLPAGTSDYSMDYASRQPLYRCSFLVFWPIIPIWTKRPNPMVSSWTSSKRQNCLCSVGMDYNHGTGHGVGAYLAVHEGPVGVGRGTSVLQVVCLTAHWKQMELPLGSSSN